ncbi:MAG: hypothetical protein Q7S35_05370 [Candidatus Limnocylindrales bacterium]|nr:hypothetical protein [Candidatus Limnocylindrales bacterium]
MNPPQPVTSSRIARPKLVATWLLAAGLGGGLGLATALIGGARLGYLAMLAMVLGLPFIARTRLRRLGVSGLLLGFAGVLGIGLPDGPQDCSTNALMFACVPTAGVAWAVVTGVALVEALVSLLWAARDGVGPSLVSASARDRNRRLRSGRALIGELERTLGIGVMIQSIDKRPPVTINALLMFGRQGREVTASGPSEAEAWQELAEIAMAWRKANDKQVSLWWGGGSV